MRHLASGLLVLASLSQLACEEALRPCVPTDAPRVEFSDSSVQVRIGATTKIGVRLHDSCGEPMSAVSTPLLLSSIPSGKVSLSRVLDSIAVFALDTGSTALRVQVGPTLAEIGVQVVPPLPVRELTISPTLASITVGVTLASFSVTARDSLGLLVQARWVPLTWAVDSGAAEMVATGVFSQPVAGTSIVRVRHGSVEARARIVGTNPSISSVLVFPEYRFRVGDSGDVQAYGYANFGGRPYFVRSGADEWRSLDTNVVTVERLPDGSGRVRALAAGRTVVAARMGALWSSQTIDNLVVLAEPTLLAATWSSATCAVVASDFGAVCWGVASWNGVPSQLPGGRRFRTADAGQDLGCGLLQDSTAVCWGEGFQGELGSGSMFEDTPTPIAVVGGHRFSSLAFWGSHSCGIAADSLAWCWGQGYHGQLGNGATAARSSPVQVAGGHKFVQISTSYARTCGVRVDSAILCWGAVGSFDSASSDELVPSLLVGFEPAQLVLLAPAVSCMLSVANAVWCWTDSFTPRYRIPAFDGATSLSIEDPFSRVCATLPSGVSCARVTLGGDFEDEVQGFADPEPVPLSVRIVRLEAGSQHTCGLGVDGSVWCWGVNGYGELGDGTTAPRFTPVRVIAPPTIP